MINRYDNAECIKKTKLILNAYISDVKNIFVLDYFNGLSGILSLLRDVYYSCQNFDIKNQIQHAILLTEKQILNSIKNIPESIGFSHGTSGIIYGLLRGYEVTNNPKSLEVVKILIKSDEKKIKNIYEDFTLSHGLVGVLLSRALYKKHSPDYRIQNHINYLKENYCFNNHSICNGASGFVELCNILEDLGFNYLGNEKLKLISYLIKEDNFLSGFPSNINSWNLLLGKTGLLYVLKRSINKNIINVI